MSKVEVVTIVVQAIINHPNDFFDPEDWITMKVNDALNGCQEDELVGHFQIDSRIDTRVWSGDAPELNADPLEHI